MRRLPIRWRLTAAFAAALAVLLTGLGMFIYLRLAADLDRAIERDLQARAGVLIGLVSGPSVSLVRPTTAALEADEDVAQIIRIDGTVLAASSYADVALLTPDQRRAALTGVQFVDRAGDGALDEDLRLLVSPASIGGETMIVVVGASLDEKAEALAALLRLEVVGFTATLLVAAGVGYRVAGSALRPVETLRRRAAELGPEELDPAHRRLPAPLVDDEIGRLGRTLNALLDRIHDAQLAEQAALARQRSFVADASHQLRTPLTILKAEVELALDTRADPGALRAALTSIGEEADRLTVLTDELLLLAAADQAALVLDREVLGAAELLEGVAARYRPRLVGSGRELRVEAASDVTVVGDRRRLEQALGNLVDNALQHGSGGIVLMAEADDCGVQLAVEDSGPGFGAGPVEEPFERFRRGSDRSGTGLGLAIVRALAVAHGGSATASGRRVTLSLPRAPGRANA